MFLFKNIAENKKFHRALVSIYDIYRHSRKRIISMHSDFVNNSQKYYYLIPDKPFFCFNLRNIVIKNLWNFKILKICKTFTDASTHTTSINVNDVRGSLILDYGFADETPLKITFTIDHLLISIQKKINWVSAQARHYHIDRVDNVSLTYRQSSAIMYEIESAIAYSLFPLMKGKL